MTIFSILFTVNALPVFFCSLLRGLICCAKQTQTTYILTLDLRMPSVLTEAGFSFYGRLEPTISNHPTPTEQRAGLFLLAPLARIVRSCVHACVMCRVCRRRSWRKAGDTPCRMHVKCAHVRGADTHSLVLCFWM